MSQIIFLAIPVFVILALAEYIYGKLTSYNTYRLNDTISSLSQGLLSQAVAACTPLFQIGFYNMLYHAANPTNSVFWENWYGIAIAVVIYDFCDYWLHRTSHECNFFWAAHVVHHQSQQFNYSTALRQESFYPIVGCMFFFPMALLGIPPEIFGTAAIAVLFYQFWVHTEHIGKLGWFDLIFTSPSNHRVHHAINDRYIDKNYGAIMILWDRMFGTFEPEREACIYGTLTPLNSWNPVFALSTVFLNMGKNVIHASTWADKVRFIYKNPGWSPYSSKKAVTKIDRQIKYDPPVTNNQGFVTVILFIIASTETFMLMWHEEDLGLTQKLMATILIAVTLWIAGRIISRNR